MDLLATVRKEGSRGGRTDFKWSDVQNSSHREHYLGHSLMAPVGRWARNRDLNWYTKANQGSDDREDPAEKAARERKEEIRHIKEAEEDALARALGLPVPDRSNANLLPVSDKREVDKVVKDATEAGSDVGKGIGFGKSGPAIGGIVNERIEDADTATMNTDVNGKIAAEAEIAIDDTTNLIVVIGPDTVTDLANDATEEDRGQDLAVLITNTREDGDTDHGQDRRIGLENTVTDDEHGTKLWSSVILGHSAH